MRKPSIPTGRSRPEAPRRGPVLHGARAFFGAPQDKRAARDRGADDFSDVDRDAPRAAPPRRSPPPRSVAAVPLHAPDAIPTPVLGRAELERRVLHIDAHLIILDKPAGLAVHRGPSTPQSLEAYLDWLCFGFMRKPQ